jgi:hypothetical protein
VFGGVLVSVLERSRNEWIGNEMRSKRAYERETKRKRNGEIRTKGTKQSETE